MKRKLNINNLNIFLILIISSSFIKAQEIIVPVSEKNRFACSSFLKPSKVSSYGPENISDFDQSTAWVEGVKGDGIGEWVAIFLGKLDELKDISEVEVTLFAGYQKNIESFKNNSIPTKLQVELFVDKKVVSSSILTEPEENWQAGTRKINLKPTLPDKKSGSIWLKVTILKVLSGEKWTDTAISEVLCNFKHADPHSVKMSISKFCKAINEKNFRVIQDYTSQDVQDIINGFTNEFAPEYGPNCNLNALIHSEKSIYLYAVEGGDGNSYAKFTYEAGKWKFNAFSYFTGM